MKRNLVLVFVYFISCTLFGQEINNGSFTIWTGNAPSSWGTFSQAIFSGSQANVGLEVIDSFNFSSKPSIQIKTDSIVVGTSKIFTAGILVYGGISYNIGKGLSFYGTPFTYRPDTFSFSYKYTTQMKDTAYFELNLTKQIAGKDSFIYGGESGFILDTSSVFKEVSVLLTPNYFSSINPDTVFMLFTPSIGSPKKGSTLWIDDVRFGYTNATTSIDGITPISSVAVYPNPAKGWVNVRIAEEQIGGVAQITDMTGREVSLVPIEKAITFTNISGLESGLYFISVKNIKGILVAQSKLSVLN